MSYETGSGLIVTTSRGLPPRDVTPNVNDPLGTVGPNVDAGFGDTHVMYPESDPPFEAQAWAGWPVGWAVPSTANAALSWRTRVEAVFAAIDLNSAVLSTMPPYIVTGSTRQPPASWLTTPEPLVYASWIEFLREVVWCYQAVGEVFIYATARFADGYPRRFIMLNPAFVNVELVDGRRRYAIGGQDVSDDVLHLRYISWPGDAHGHGPLEVAGARMLAAETLTTYAAGLAQAGGMPWAVLKYPRRLTSAQMRKLQSDWLVARRSAMGAPAVLADGVEVEVLANNPRDMALDELAKFTEARLAVLLGVPPFLLGLPSGGDSMTYSNVSSLFDFHWRAGLRPKASTIMTALSNWLLPAGTRVELDRDEYVRPGLAERAAAYEVLHRIGAMTPEEIRERERLLGVPAPVTN